MSEHYDVIVIGTGAGGGTLARHLAPSGKRILLLERGDWLPREPENWSTGEVFVDGRYISKDSWYDVKGKSFFQPQVHYFVGGATKLYGAALYRMRAEDFGELHHHDGLSPAWPISYQDMEPYYTATEQMYQVHGARGEDPTEPPARAPYPYPAVSHEPRVQQLSDDLAKSGYHPFHAPCGILVDESSMPYSICVRCEACDGFPCPLHAKSDAEVIGIRPALKHPNVTLLRNARAVKLETNPAGTAVTAVVVERDGQTERYHGHIVVVSCGAANSAKLLLASAYDKHPNGLANGSDQVGRNFMSTTARRCSPCRRSRTRPSSKRPSASTTSTSAARTSSTDGQHPDDGQSQRRCSAGEADQESSRPVGLPFRRARRRLLAVPRGPAAGRPGHARPGRRRPHRLRAERPHRRQATLRPAQVHARRARPARRPRVHRFAYMKTDVPVRRLRAPGRDHPVRRRPGDVVLDPDSAPTKSTTCTWQTQHLPEHQRGEPGPYRDGERRPVGDHLLERLG